MANIRVLKIKTSDSTSIIAKFTQQLDLLIGVDNISVTSNVSGIPNPKVLDVEVIQDVLNITVQPMTPFIPYLVEFKSTNVQPFRSLDGLSFLFQDGVTNVLQVLGAENPDDPIRNYLTGYLQNNVYNLDPNSLSRFILNSISGNLSEALYDIRQAKNDNYLSFTVQNEFKTRGAGPFDRLNEEGAYEIISVSKNATDTTLSGAMSFDTFPSGPITLQGISVNETLIAGFGDSTFNGLILTVAHHPVTKLDSVTILYQNGSSAIYDVSVLGYQIQNDRYDQDFASTFLTLNDNQFKFSDQVLTDPTFILPRAGDAIRVTYEYKNLGRVVTENSVIVSQMLQAVREITPPIETQFNLAHAPVVVNGDIIATSNGVIFLDPSANPPFSSSHPAFLVELPFRLEGLPKNPGEFSIDYPNGTVYVFGASTNDGTGDFPPVATYQYRNTFSSRLDFTYDPDFVELVASPLRDLIGQTAKISFQYSDDFIPGVDFNEQIHTEVLDERVQNRVQTNGSLGVLNTPITNVFRVFNETTGEVYRISRWNDHTIFFVANNPPRVFDVNRERATFTEIANELLIVNNELANTSNVKIFQLLLQNSPIISSSEDVIGSSFNSSASFSRTDIFSKELYFDSQILTITENLERLSVGDYQIDYRNGIVYLGVSTAQDFDLGTINYKNSVIAPANSHVISVSEIYNSISTIQAINKRISYTSFADDGVTPSTFDISDERFLNGDTTLPYIVSNNTILVSDDIKNVRNIFDVFDLNNHDTPTNFADGASVSANIITLSPVSKQDASVIGAGLIVSVPFITFGAEIASVISVVRISDNVELYDNSSSFAGYNITLSGATGSPMVGQPVFITYAVKMNGGATPVVDYNRGDYFIDYTYLADEILVSYEYGDNCLDFRQSSMDEDTNYFVTYKVGALRDALLKNFGTLVNLPILNSFDTSLPRENYRDALQAALQSFTKGPTIPAIKSLVSHITHIDPEIIESAFQNWSLGISHLYPNAIDYSGDIQLLVGKYDNGALIANPGENITFPVSSNLRLEEGTLETWIIPEWDGLDNDATLTFSSITKNNVLLPSNQIYIGADSHHPTYNLQNIFSVNKADPVSPIGLPSAIFTQTGLFIFYDDVVKRWKVLVKDIAVDGYFYQGSIVSSGEVYDVKFTDGLGEINDILRSGTSTIDFQFNIDANDAISPDGYTTGDGYVPGYSFDGIDFMADDEHYIFDFGRANDSDRFSLYKDGKGYLNFRVFDKGNTPNRKNQYKVSADISDWTAGQKHHIALAWRLNSPDRRDEMHLFIDGFEVPNIIRYGGRPVVTSSDRFRTVKPEIVAGTVPLNTITGNDLITTVNSNIVIGSINFDDAGIVPGNTIQILEPGFSAYNITAVNNFQLTLDSNMPTSLLDARYSVNPYAVVVASEIDLFNNIAVSIIHNSIETEIPGLRADIPAYAVSLNAMNQTVLTILGDAAVGDQVVIRTLGLNHRRCRDRQFIWGNTTNILKTQLPPPINLDEVKIIPVMLPLTSIGPENSTFGGGVFTSNALATSQPSNEIQGRTLSVRVAGGNVDFSTPVSVTITGAPSNQTLTFNSPGTQNTSGKFTGITSVTVVSKPIINSTDSAAIEIKEAFPITYSEGNSAYPVIRFSYKTQLGSSLQGNGSNIVSDANGFFPESLIGQSLVISAPGPVSGTYIITGRIDDNTVTVSPTPSTSFTNGTYNIYNVSIGRSGFQNGFFTLEQAGGVNVPYLLNQGYFDFDYSAYLEVPMTPFGNQQAYLGSDFHGKKQAKAILDEFIILSTKLTDVRVGESITPKQESITTDFTSLKALKPNSTTLMLLHLDELPFVNSADFWVSANKEYLQSDASVNDNFEKSLVITDAPFIVDNKGLLSTISEGSIEFWVSPRYDTYNDPNFRFYFDASGSIVEEVTSISSGVVKVSNRISQIISVTLDTDATVAGTDYFQGGNIASDFQTINLGKALPYQQTPVKVNYIPSGLSGNRISIYKDQQGYITFNVRANGIDYQVRQPVFWERDSWHRVRATYKFNRADNKDEIRLFIDGEERGTVLFGQGLLFGPNLIFGQGFAGVDNSILTDDINFKDPINQFFIGSDYLGVNTAYARFDNIRLSDVSRAPFLVANQPIDVNYSSNLSTVLPVVPDAFTTYLMDFNTMLIKTTDLALLRDEAFGIFNFTLNIIDSFDIVLSNPKIKQVLEELIAALKPAQSKATINYFQ